MAIFDLARCDVGETWRDDDGTISTAVYNLVFNLERQEFEKFALMVRQTQSALAARRPEGSEGDTYPLATCEMGQTYLEPGGEITVMLYNFSFCLGPQEFAAFADMVARTDRLLAEEFPPEP